METTSYEMTARDYLRVIFRQKAVILTCIFTVTATVYIGLKLKTPVYEARVKMLISAEKQVDSPYYRELLAGRSGEAALTQSEIVQSNPVMERAVLALKLYQRAPDYEKEFSSPFKVPLIEMRMRGINRTLAGYGDSERNAILFQSALAHIRASTKAEPIRDTNLFTISVRDYNPVAAAVIANVISRSYVIFDLEQQLAELQLKYGGKHQTVQQLKDNIDGMIRSLSGERLPNIEAIGPASVKVIEQAQIPLRPSGPGNILVVLLGVVMSVFLGVMLAFVFDYMDQTFKSVEDVERYFNLPLLGSVPRRSFGDRILLKDARRSSVYTGFYRTLSEQLYLVMKDKKLKTMLFVSAEEREGATTVIANLGYYLAQKLSHKVLIIDANLRNPCLHRAWKMESGKGLAGVLEGKVSFEDAVRTVEGRLHLLAAGATELNPITLLDSHMMRQVFKLAQEKYEVVLVDSAHLNGYKDSLLLSAYADGVVIVISEGKVRRQVIKAAIAPLEGRKVNITGIILNNRVFAIPKAIYERI